MQRAREIEKERERKMEREGGRERKKQREREREREREMERERAINAFVWRRVGVNRKETLVRSESQITLENGRKV